MDNIIQSWSTEINKQALYHGDVVKGGSNKYRNKKKKETDDVTSSAST